MAHTLIIAEAGVNHNGSMDIARQLIDAAVDAGVDIIKFQTFKADRLVSKDAKKAAYQQQNTADGNDSQYDMLKQLELTEQDHEQLMAYCKAKGIRFWSTAFDLESIDYLHSLGMTMWKIPSGEITNYPFIRKVAQCADRVIMSTGMCDEADVRRAIEVLTRHGVSQDRITILHCNTQYPTPYEDVNLKAMQTIAREFGVGVGYSDHTPGIEVPIAAVALGAEVIEKHFTLDRTLPGPDHKASLEPHELKAMVAAIRHIEQALGDGVKRVTDSERANIAVARKSIVAARPIRQGETLTEDNLTVKRPGTGISPMEWESVVGKAACRDFNTDEQIILS